MHTPFSDHSAIMLNIQSRMLQYWFEFKDVQNNKMPCTKKTIIWNNQDIKIDNKSIFFRTWFDKGVYTLQSTQVTREQYFQE